MSRTTSILVFVQTLLVILGFFALAIVLKACGYPDYHGVLWNPLPVFLRKHGIWLPLLPMMWAFFAARAERRGYGVLSSRMTLIIGVGIASAIIAVFLYAAIFPYSLPMILKVR